MSIIMVSEFSTLRSTVYANTEIDRLRPCFALHVHYDNVGIYFVPRIVQGIMLYSVFFQNRFDFVRYEQYHYVALRLY